MSDSKKIWDDFSETHSTNKEPEDNWLRPWLEQFAKDRLTIVELGCGPGEDSGFLSKTGHNLICCDFSEKALERVSALSPDISTRLFDLRDTFPIEDNTADIVVASLCLHYFKDEDMHRILAEIRRVLRAGGTLLCRLNSMRDIRPSGDCEAQLAPGIIMTDVGIKRFYDEVAIRQVFGSWEIFFIEEKITQKFSRQKALWEIALRAPL